MTRDLRYWDRVSGKPAEMVEKLSTQQAFRHLIRTTLTLRPGDRVLDLGCGTGAYLSTLRDAVGPDGHVLGIDYSPKMLAKAAARAAAWDNVEVRQTDATTVALEPGTYDAVLASFSISATQDVPATVANVHRALRPGGRLFAPDMHLVPRGLGAPVMWTLGLAYRLIARWTGVDVLATVRTEFGTAVTVNAQGDPLPRVPTFAPVLMITATKVTTLA